MSCVNRYNGTGGALQNASGCAADSSVPDKPLSSLSEEDYLNHRRKGIALRLRYLGRIIPTLKDTFNEACQRFPPNKENMMRGRLKYAHDKLQGEGVQGEKLLYVLESMGQYFTQPNGGRPDIFEEEGDPDLGLEAYIRESLRLSWFPENQQQAAWEWIESQKPYIPSREGNPLFEAASAAGRIHLLYDLSLLYGNLKRFENMDE